MLDNQCNQCFYYKKFVILVFLVFQNPTRASPQYNQINPQLFYGFFKILPIFAHDLPNKEINVTNLKPVRL